MRRLWHRLGRRAYERGYVRGWDANPCNDLAEVRAAVGALVDEAQDPTRFGEDDDTGLLVIWVSRETWDRLAVHREARS